MNKEYILSVLLKLQKIYERELEYISGLDAAIGDGDHGASMVRGFKAVNGVLSENAEEASIPSMLETTGRTLLKEIGGTCGPLYGMLFIKGAAAVRENDVWDTHTLHSFFKAGLDGIMALGKAQPGEKTMVDALYPAVGALKEAEGKNLDVFEAANKAKLAAEAGRDSTRDMIPQRGRGRYQGEAAVGHVDAGAASMAILIGAFSQ